MARQPNPTISAVLIVKDEENYLTRCLESVRWADEIVVYDTGSTDRTVEIARQFTDLVVEGYWDDDFGAARNRALEHATSVWVLSVDADEQFDGDPRAVRRHLAEAKANLFTVSLKAQVSAPSAPDVPLALARIFRRDDAQWAGALHEQIAPRPGCRMVLRPMPGASVRHAGYSEGPEAMAERHRRNLELAERELAAVAAVAAPGSAALAIKRANLARSLCGAGRVAEGLDLAEKVYADGVLPDAGLDLLTRAMCLMAAGATDFTRARTWAERSRPVVGNAVWAEELFVKIGAMEGSPEAVLDALECVPTTVVDAKGRRARRVDYARFEAWALCRTGRVDDAIQVAERAAALGVLAGEPLELWIWLGEAGFRRVAAALTDEAWQLLAVLCTHAQQVPAARRMLEIMTEVRPDDLAPLLCAMKLSFPHDLQGLEEAARWSARVRAFGMDADCPLIAIARDANVPAPQRARAAALAHFAYGDGRALPALESALADVAPADESELSAHLDVLAPGLVQQA
ncbi:glycosyltransferase family 2 protein [Georgenia sp. Marseille-Q6866]